MSKIQHLMILRKQPFSIIVEDMKFADVHCGEWSVNMCQLLWP